MLLVNLGWRVLLLGREEMGREVGWLVKISIMSNKVE